MSSLRDIVGFPEKIFVISSPETPNAKSILINFNNYILLHSNSEKYILEIRKNYNIPVEMIFELVNKKSFLPFNVILLNSVLTLEEEKMLLRVNYEQKLYSLDAKISNYVKLKPKNFYEINEFGKVDADMSKIEEVAEIFGFAKTIGALDNRCVMKLFNVVEYFKNNKITDKDSLNLLKIYFSFLLKKESKEFNSLNLKEICAKHYTHKFLFDEIILKLLDDEACIILNEQYKISISCSSEEIRLYFRNYFYPPKCKFSLILTSYNRERAVFRAIDSYLNSYNNNTELIIIDNNSNVDLKMKIKDYCDGHDNIKVLFLNENYYCGARNKAFEHLSGEYISFIDDDDIIAKDYFIKLDENIQRYKFDILRFNFVHVNQYANMHDSISYFIAKNEAIYNLTSLNVSTKVGDLRDKIVSSCSMCFRKDLLDEHKFLEKILFEDNAFYYRLLLKVNSVKFMSNGIYYREISDTSIMANSNARKLDMERMSVICIFIDMLIASDDYQISEFEIIYTWLKTNLRTSDQELVNSIISKYIGINRENYKEKIKNERIKDIMLQRYN